jgi:hypothetical protein
MSKEKICMYYCDVHSTKYLLYNRLLDGISSPGKCKESLQIW